MQDDAGRPSSSDRASSTMRAWRHGRLLPTNRLEAFSDGVFAIAITLLVLELHVPTAKEGLLSELAKEWPTYVGYFISFAFIGFLVASVVLLLEPLVRSPRRGSGGRAAG